MAAAATLTEAAQIAWDNLAQYNFAGLQTALSRLSAFVGDMETEFPDDGTQAERAVSNWIVIGRMAVTSIGLGIGGYIPDRKFSVAALWLYRFCWAAATAESAGRITAPQAAAILADYNTRFA